MCVEVLCISEELRLPLCVCLIIMCVYSACNLQKCTCKRITLSNHLWRSEQLIEHFASSILLLIFLCKATNTSALFICTAYIQGLLVYIHTV